MLSRSPWQTWSVIDDRITRLAAAPLYLVCDAIPDERLSAALRGGVQLVQLRMKGAPTQEILAVARRFRERCAEHSVPLIINDHPELVAPAGADGVHLGQDDMAIETARDLLGRDHIIGLSTHDPDQLESAHDLAVDYIGVGPVHSTPTKPGRPAVGLELISHAARHARLPFFAIGGINLQNISSVLAAGAERVAVVRAISRADDPELAARELNALLRNGVGVGAA
jgi:thiamine-phosphate pyrophosphorylase